MKIANKTGFFRPVLFHFILKWVIINRFVEQSVKNALFLCDLMEML